MSATERSGERCLLRDAYGEAARRCADIPDPDRRHEMVWPVAEAIYLEQVEATTLGVELLQERTTQ